MRRVGRRRRLLDDESSRVENRFRVDRFRLPQELLLERRRLEHVTRAQLFRRHGMRLLVVQLERVFEDP